MSEAFKNCDLQLMAEYDFKAPINATIEIYDDSDEDNNSSVEKEQTNNITTKNIDSIVSELIEDINRVSNKTKNVTNVSSAKRRLSSESRGKKRKKSINTSVLENQTESLNRNRADLSNNTINSMNNQCSNNSQVFSNTLQASNEIRPLVCIPQIAFPQSQEDINTKANECVQSLLDTVSTHIIFIMKAYMEYVVVTRRTSDRTVIEKAKKNYLDAKSHFFYLSFSTVTNIMLPKENDPVFVMQFIENTFELAKARNLYVKYCDIKFLCDEMLVWVKSYKQHPILSGLLKPHQSNTVTSNKNCCREHQSCLNSNSALDKTCAFRNEPPGRELLSGSQKSQSAMQQYYNVNAEINVQNKSPSGWGEQLLEAPHYNLHYPNQPPKSNQPRAINAQAQIHHNPISPPEVTSRPPPPYHLKQTWQQDVIVSPQIYSENQLDSANYYPTIQPDHGQINRSVSRDSGFMSPLSSNDTTCSSPKIDRIDSPSTLTTPFITHVTSLNPNAAYIKNGICHVCSKLTQQKCLGCYKTYYCSHQCQNIDWKNHVRICK